MRGYLDTKDNDGFDIAVLQMFLDFRNYHREEGLWGSTEEEWAE